MPYEKEEDERSEINWDRLGGEGVLKIVRREEYAMRDYFLHPLTAKAVPSPYKQGESAIQTFFTLRKGYSLLPTTYYLLLK